MASSYVNKCTESEINLQSIDLESNDAPNSEPLLEEPKAKKAKATTSNVWKYFSKIGIVDGREKAKCNGCGTLYTIGGMKY